MPVEAARSGKSACLPAAVGNGAAGPTAPAAAAASPSSGKAGPAIASRLGWAPQNEPASSIRACSFAHARSIRLGRKLQLQCSGACVTGASLLQSAYCCRRTAAAISNKAKCHHPAAAQCLHDQHSAVSTSHHITAPLGELLSKLQSELCGLRRRGASWQALRHLNQRHAVEGRRSQRGAAASRPARDEARRVQGAG